MKRGGQTVITPEQVRAFSFARQGLDGSLKKKSAGEILAATGWLRSVGGARRRTKVRSAPDQSQAAGDATISAARARTRAASRGPSAESPTSVCARSGSARRPKSASSAS